MVRPTVTQRLRARLQSLLKHGDQTAIERWSHERPGGSKISQQELSYFLKQRKGRRGLIIDDLDDLAAYFRVSIGDLVGDTELGDLAADEQRMVYAFRALPQAHRDQFLSILEAMSVSSQKYLPRQPLPRIREPQQAGGVDGPPRVPAHTAEITGEHDTPEVRRLRLAIGRAIDTLSDAAASDDLHGSLPNARADEA